MKNLKLAMEYVAEAIRCLNSSDLSKTAFVRTVAQDLITVQKKILTFGEPEKPTISPKRKTNVEPENS